MSSKVFAKAILCKKYNYEEDSIENILSQIEVTNDMTSSFYLYLSAKILNDTTANDFFRVLIFIKTENMIREIGNFKIPIDEQDRDRDRDRDMFEYRVIFNMEDFDFPCVGKYNMDICFVEEEEYQKFITDNENGDQSNSSYKLLKKNDKNLLDRVVFDVVVN